MLELFFRQAQYGAIFLFVAGAFGWWVSTGVGAWHGATRSAQTEREQEREQEILRNIFYARFITYGMAVSGLVWWVIEG
jgi:hypothetical protein